ncbi:hypothetical protein F4779DRAFT_589542 [Xylariaceae sp. FL0662B]|nr:hypothetical protein F4779DRAFT_589542 [Xylariaceae sp. FL0662B]
MIWLPLLFFVLLPRNFETHWMYNTLVPAGNLLTKNLNSVSLDHVVRPPKRPRRCHYYLFPNNALVVGLIP